MPNLADVLPLEETDECVHCFVDRGSGRSGSRGWGRSGGRRPVLEWRGLDESAVLSGAGDIRPAMTVVVPGSYGGCDKWGWNPASATEVADIGDPVKLRRGRPILRLHAELVSAWNDAKLVRRLANVESVAAARVALDGAVGADAAEWVREAVSALRRSRTVKLVVNPDDDSEPPVAITATGVFQQESIRASYTAEVGLDFRRTGSVARTTASSGGD